MRKITGPVPALCFFAGCAASADDEENVLCIDKAIKIDESIKGRGAADAKE